MSKSIESICRKRAIADLAAIGDPVPSNASYMDIAAKIMKHYRAVSDDVLDAQMARAIIARQFRHGLSEVPTINRRATASA
jgi:hypothetical protein